MATTNKITEIIAAIKTIYSYYAKETDVATLVKTWNVLLKDFPDEAVDVAFYKCLQTCKMPPTPADVIEKIEAIYKANEPTDEELWSVFSKALKETERQVYYFRFNAIMPNGLTQGENARNRVETIWQELPEKVRKYIGGKGEFIRMSQYGEDDLKYEKNRFLKTMPIIHKRCEYSKLYSLSDPSAAVGLLKE